MSEQKTDIMQFLKMNIHRQQKKINRLKKKISELEAINAELLGALEVAQQFIQNGIQYGYINMPDKDCGDSALETPAKIEAAIQKVMGNERENLL